MTTTQADLKTARSDHTGALKRPEWLLELYARHGEGTASAEEVREGQQRAVKEVLDKPHGLSGADIEAILARAVLASDAGPGSGDGGDRPVSVETLRHAFSDFIPATSPLERELQILVAVQECTSREVLPERYRSMEREAVLSRINELRALLNS